MKLAEYVIAAVCVIWTSFVWLFRLFIALLLTMAVMSVLAYCSRAKITDEEIQQIIAEEQMLLDLKADCVPIDVEVN